MDSKLHCGITIDWPGPGGESGLSEDEWITQALTERRAAIHVLARVAALAAPHIAFDRIVHGCWVGAIPVRYEHPTQEPIFATRDADRDTADVCEFGLSPLSQLVGWRADRGYTPEPSECASLQLIIPKDLVDLYRRRLQMWLAAAIDDAR